MRFKILLPWLLLAGVLGWLWMPHAPSVIPNMTPSLPTERAPAVTVPSPISGPFLMLGPCKWRLLPWSISTPRRKLNGKCTP